MLNTRRVVLSLLSLVAVLAITTNPSSVQAQFTNFNFGNQVGGIRVDTAGVLGMAPVLDTNLKQKMDQDLSASQLKGTDKYRKLSLRVLNQIVKDSFEQGSPIPAEARYLGGLMRVQRIVIDHAHNDIVLMGPAEELVVAANGSVVGKESGRPALQLQDLMVALQASDAATTGQGISVSIEPTNQGRLAFEQVTAAAQRSGVAAAALVNNLERAMGNQKVILTGISQDTRYANVLALADYKMKRISMGLDQSPVQGLPSFLSMLTRSTNLSPLTPRFWMEMNYQPITHSDDKNVWQLNGTGVKTLTETDFVNADGSTTATGRRNPLAAKWAGLMTQHYEALMSAEPVFGELRNIFDLSVVAALMDKEEMLAKVGLELDALLQSHQALHQWNTPSEVSTTASVVAARRGNLVAASGGVQLDPWTVVNDVKVDTDLAVALNEVAHSDGKQLFWD